MHKNGRFLCIIFKFGSESGSSDPAIWVVFSKNYVYSTSKGLNWSLNIVLTYFFDVVKVQVIFIIIMKILKRGWGGEPLSKKTFFRIRNCALKSDPKSAHESDPKLDDNFLHIVEKIIPYPIERTINHIRTASTIRYICVWIGIV